MGIAGARMGEARLLGSAADGNGVASFLCTDLLAASNWGGPFNGPSAEQPDGSDSDLVGRALASITETERRPRLHRVACRRCTVDVVSFGYTGWMLAFEIGSGLALVDATHDDTDSMKVRSSIGQIERVPSDGGFFDFVVRRPVRTRVGSIEVASGWLLLLSIHQDIESLGRRFVEDVLRGREPVVQRRTDDGGHALALRVAARSYRVSFDCQAERYWQRVALTPTSDGGGRRAARRRR